MQPISSVKLQTSNITTAGQRVTGTKENLEPEDQVTLGSTHETPDFLQLSGKYKHSALSSARERETSTGEVKTVHYKRPGNSELVKRNTTNGIKKLITSVIDGAKVGGAIGWVGSLAALGPLGAVVGVPAAIIGGTVGA